MENKLTKRELEIIEILTQGKNAAAIADQLCISDGTVKQHLHKIYRKLNVNSQLQAVIAYNAAKQH